MSDSAKRQGMIGRLWSAFWRPSVSIAAGVLLVVGFVGGIVFWGGFNWSMELTNTETFCISCHEMEENVFVEYRHTIHYSNRTGVRATCPRLSRAEDLGAQDGSENQGECRALSSLHADREHT